MNKLLFASFTVFWGLVLAIIGLDALSPENAQEPDAGQRIITMAELTQHNNADSCWKLIRGEVFDVTEFIRQHPTVPETMLEWCGRESTEAMETKGYGRPHSNAAWEMLDQYKIGRIASE